MIISTNNYRYDTIWVNDFTYKSYLKIDKIDTANAVIFRNNLSSVPKNLTLRKYTEGEDFYSNYLNAQCACLGKALEQGKAYSDLFFIKKEKNEYQVLMWLKDLESEQLEACRQQIATAGSFEKIKDEKKRFAKTLDWFIENALMPDADFIEYYKQKNIIVDSIQYSEKQYQKALQVFQSGKGALLPMVRKRYFEDIKQHYVQKMENILEIEEPDYKDYYAFSQAFSAIAGDYGLDYDSADYVLYDSITSDKFDKYDKRKVMQHLLEIAKKWK